MEYNGILELFNTSGLEAADASFAQFDKDEQAAEQFKLDNPITAELPNFAQRGILGLTDVSHGLKDIAAMTDSSRAFETGNGPWQQRQDARHAEQKDFRGNINMLTGSRNPEANTIAGEMQEYLPDMAMAALTSGISLTGEALKGGLKLGAMGAKQASKGLAKGLGRPGASPIDEAIGLGKSKWSKGRREMLDLADDIGETAQAEFLHGKLREDEDKGILDSMSYEALAGEVMFDLGLKGILKGAATPARMKRNAQLKELQDSRPEVTAKEESTIRQAVSNDIMKDNSVATVDRLKEDPYNKKILDIYVDELESLKAKAEGKEHVSSLKKEEPKATATPDKPAPKKSRKSTAEFKSEDTAKSQSDRIKEMRKDTSSTNDVTLSNLESRSKQLDQVDTSKLNTEQKARHTVEVKELDALKPKAVELEKKLASERVEKMSDKKLRTTRARNKKRTGELTERNKIFNEAVEAGYKARKPEQVVTVSDKAKETTDKSMGAKFSRNEFLDKDNPKESSKKAITEARKSPEYNDMIDEILVKQEDLYVEKNEGTATGQKWKDLTINEKRNVIKKMIDEGDHTIAQRVAMSDIYNENTNRMYKGAKKSSGPSKADITAAQAAKKKSSPEPKVEVKLEVKADKPVKEDFTYKKETPKVKPESKKASRTSRFKKRSSTGGLEGSSVKGRSMTRIHALKQTKGTTEPKIEVAPEKFTGEQKDALAFHEDGTITLRSWLNGGKTLDHELLHYLLDAAYDNDPKLKELTNVVMKEAYDSIDKLDLAPLFKNKLKDAYKTDPQEMLVTVLAVPEYVKAFGQVESTRPKAKTILDSMINLIKQVIDSLTGAKDNSVAHQMVDLMVKQSEWAADARQVSRDIASNKRYASPTETLNRLEPLASKYITGIASRTWGQIDKLYRHMDKDSSIIQYLESVGNGSLVHKVLTQWEVKGIPVIKSVQELANKMHDADSITRTTRGYTVQEIQALLPSEKAINGQVRTTVDEVKLADEIMGLDLQSLPKSTLDELIENNFSQATTDKHITSLKKQLGAVMHKNNVKSKSGFIKAQRFLIEQILGNQKSKEVRGYATNNTNQLLYNFTDIKGKNSELEKIMDSYITMQAMSKRRPAELKKLDADNLKEIVALHRHSVNLFKQSNGTGPQYRKGFIGGSMDPYWEYEYMDTTTYAALKNKDGWNKIAPASDPGYVHVKRRATYLKYEKGAIPTNQYIAMGGKHYESPSDMLKDLGQDRRSKGESKRHFNRRIMAAGRKKLKGDFEPYYDMNGMVTGYRSVMSNSMKRQHLGFQSKLSDSIANNIMDAQREVVHNEIVNTVNKSMVTDITGGTSQKKINSMIENVSDSEKSLMLRGDSVDIRNKINKHVLDRYYEEVTPDIRAILPSSLKDIAYINKLYKDELVGYRNDFITNGRLMNLAEMWWRDAVLHFKESVIKKNPIAMMTNAMGNNIMLMLEGADPMFLASETVKAKRDIDAMYAGVKQLNKLELQLGRHKAGTQAYKTTQAKIDAQTAKLKGMEAYKGITDGWYQSAIDDIYDAEHSSASPISKVTESAYKKMIEKTGIKNKSTADNIFKSGCDMMLTQHSRAGRAAGKLLAYSDYTARLMMYRLKKQQGMGSDSASKMARDSFVDYRRQLPKELNALKVGGIVPFITWAYRMQPVLAKRALANPIKTAALLGTYGVVSEDMGMVGNARVGNWIPQTAFADPSIIGGLPLSMAKGDFPVEIMVPELWTYASKGEFDKMAGIDIR